MRFFGLFAIAIFLVGCSKQNEASTEPKEQNVHAVADTKSNNAYKALIGKNLEEVARTLGEKGFDQQQRSIFEKDTVLMIVEYAPTGLGTIFDISTIPDTKLPKELVKSHSIDGFSEIAKKYDWIEQEDGIVIFQKNNINEEKKIITFENLAVRHQISEPKKVSSISSF